MKYLFFCISLLFLGNLQAQPEILDRIMAVVGDEIIVQSEVEAQYNYLLTEGRQKDDGTLMCTSLEQTIIKKLLLSKAIQDSIVVSDDEITSEVDRRVDEILRRLKSPKDFIEITGKSVPQFKNDIRDIIKDELLVDRQRTKVLANANVTPKEVKDFFSGIPVDSLGLLPAEVELNHIVAFPPPSEKNRAESKRRLTEVRRKVMEENADFTEMAKKYSEEPGARQSGGNLGDFGRGMMTPEFESVVYSMRVGEVSEVFETPFGYHIVKLNSRKGEIVNASHVLMIPQPGTNGDSIAIQKLNKALALVKKDSMTFEQAAIKFSEDRESKDCGGCVLNLKNGELRIPMSQLSSEFYFKVDAMKEGEISDPQEYLTPNGKRAFHVIYLRNKIAPHAPNMKDDYKKIQTAALQSKQSEVFDKWLKSAKKNVYIEIKEGTECYEALKYWTEL
ncbi:MAG: peptidylprolyl isomerase [Bacteroidia bacterium]